MNVQKIEKIEEVLDLDKDKKIIGHKIQRLTAAGENYGSLMLSVDITVKTPKGNEEIKTVAKMVPPNEFIQKIFNTQVSFRNEIAFYKNMVPTLQNFQREHNIEKVIDFFPKYYGSRLNLKRDSSKVDSDAVLLLENLKAANFDNLERTVGFDLEGSKLVITDLAHLHAVPLALKLQKPEVFEKEIKSHLTPFLENSEKVETMRQVLKKRVEGMEESSQFLERICAGLDKFNQTAEAREPFATVSHNDCWVNNTMVKFEQNKAIHNKLVDFQVCDYGSPAKDVLFFLFSSVQSHILERYYDDLIKLYHKTFISILSELKCDIAQFSFKVFEKELDYEAINSQFFHILFMLAPIFAPRGTVKEISELTPEDFVQWEFTDLYKEKFVFFIKQFVKRHWV